MPVSAKLFTPVRFGRHEVSHRVVMAPMTRSRSTQPGDIPNAMNFRRAIRERFRNSIIVAGHTAHGYTDYPAWSGRMAAA